MPSPRTFIVNTSSEDTVKIFDGFKHRFTTLKEMVLFFEGIKNVLMEFGSLEQCFMEGYQETDKDIFHALFNFSRQLLKTSPCRNSLIPDPEKKSAFKRLNLFLRWMIRNDEVDPGGWKGVPPAKLIYPVDTHIHRLSLALGLTKKNQNDHRTAAEITDGFRKISPDDPVKYDYSLTSLSIGRPGIDNFIDQHKLLA